MLITKLVKNEDAAVHQAAQLIEYMVLNAYEMDYNWILKSLRSIAVAWGQASKQYDETLTVINLIKEEAMCHTLTAAKAWCMVKSIIHNGKHTTFQLNQSIFKNFYFSGISPIPMFRPCN